MSSKYLLIMALLILFVSDNLADSHSAFRLPKIETQQMFDLWQTFKAMFR